MSFSSVERPDTTEARQGPSPTAQHPPLCKKTPAPSGERLCGIGYLAYVVERHASACLRTVGIDIWMWKSATQEKTLERKSIQSH